MDISQKLTTNSNIDASQLQPYMYLDTPFPPLQSCDRPTQRPAAPRCPAFNRPVTLNDSNCSMTHVLPLLSPYLNFGDNHAHKAFRVPSERRRSGTSDYAPPLYMYTLSIHPFLRLLSRLSHPYADNKLKYPGFLVKCPLRLLRLYPQHSHYHLPNPLGTAECVCRFFMSGASPSKFALQTVFRISPLTFLDR